MGIWHRTIEVVGLGETMKAIDVPLFLLQTETSEVGPKSRAGLMAFRARAKQLVAGAPLSEDALAWRLAELVGGETPDGALQEAFVECFPSKEAGTAFLQAVQWGLGGDPPSGLRRISEG